MNILPLAMGNTLLVLVIDKYVNNIYCHASLK